MRGIWTWVGRLSPAGGAVNPPQPPFGKGGGEKSPPCPRGARGDWQGVARSTALARQALRLSTLFLIGTLTACSPPPTALLGLRVVAAPDANERMATSVDVVFIFDDAAISVMPDNAGDWFDKKQALLGRHPGAFKVVSLQVPPGDWVNPVELPEGWSCAYKVLAYPHLRDPKGQSALDLTPLLHAELHIERQSAQAYEIPPVTREKQP